MDLKSKLRLLSEMSGDLMERSGLADYHSGMNTDEERLFDKIILIAENDGAAYRKRDARMAFQRAAKEYMRNHMDDLRHDMAGIKNAVEKYLQDKWTNAEREAKKYQI